MKREVVLKSDAPRGPLSRHVTKVVALWALVVIAIDVRLVADWDRRSPARMAPTDAPAISEIATAPEHIEHIESLLRVAFDPPFSETPACVVASSSPHGYSWRVDPAGLEIIDFGSGQSFTYSCTGPRFTRAPAAMTCHGSGTASDPYGCGPS